MLLATIETACKIVKPTSKAFRVDVLRTCSQVVELQARTRDEARIIVPNEGGRVLRSEVQHLELLGNPVEERES
jgi:hypothetical protein